MSASVKVSSENAKQQKRPGGVRLKKPKEEPKKKRWRELKLNDWLQKKRQEGLLKKKLHELPLSKKLHELPLNKKLPGSLLSKKLPELLLNKKLPELLLNKLNLPVRKHCANNVRETNIYALQLKNKKEY